MKKVKEQRNKNEKAITLIALAVTIIALLILAGVAISLSIGNNGVVSRGQVSTEGNKLASYKEKVEMYKAEKLMEDEKFIEETLSAGKNTLEYNTKKEDGGTILNIIPELDEKYIDKLEIIKGELFLTSTDKKEVQAAKIAGIEFNPYKIEDGELQSFDTNLELMSPDGTLTIPNNVTKVGYGAFSNLEGLKTVIIPGTVKEIGAYSFSYNKTLEKVIIADGVEKIGEYAFDGVSKLKDVTLSNSLKEIGERAFRGTSIEEINIPGSVETLNSQSFSTSNLKKVVLNEGTKTLKSNSIYGAKITSISIPSTIISIERGAFEYCNLLEDFDLSNNENFVYESGFLMPKERNTILFASAKKIKESTTFEIPEKISKLETSLANYTNIKKLIIPMSLNELNPSYLPKSIEEVEVKEGNPKFIVEGNMLYDKTNSSLVMCYSKEENINNVKDGTKDILANSFKFAINSAYVTFPDSVKKISGGFNKNTTINIGKNVNNLPYTFDGGQQSCTIILDNENPYYELKNNILYKKGEDKTLVGVMYQAKDNDLAIDEDTKIIGQYAFYGQGNLQNIVLPNGIKTIKERAFIGMPELKRIEIPSSIQEIKENVFSDNTKKLEEIIIHKEEGSITGAPWGAVKGMRVVKWLP